MGLHIPAGDVSEERIVTRGDEPLGIGLTLWRLARGRTFVTSRETALVLLSGEASMRAGGALVEARRSSLFDDRPSALHVPAGVEVSVQPGPSGGEIAVAEAPGGGPSGRAASSGGARPGAAPAFEPRAHRPSDVRAEQRGKGTLREAAHREVRTIIDDDNGPPGGALVVGEVVTLPGRWSSYPPHHHRQPEIYHYRFTRPEGYGHAELGERVLKVRDRDTVIIEPGETHAQCAAPGYGMWYLWIIRHLPGDRYTTPTFDPAHAWALEPGAPVWWPHAEP